MLIIGGGIANFTNVASTFKVNATIVVWCRTLRAFSGRLVSYRWIMPVRRSRLRQFRIHCTIVPSKLVDCMYIMPLAAILPLSGDDRMMTHCNGKQGSLHWLYSIHIAGLHELAACCGAALIDHACCRAVLLDNACCRAALIDQWPRMLQGIVKALMLYQQKLIEGNVLIFVRRGGPNYQQGLSGMKQLGTGGRPTP